ncbi:flagellar hook-length control protein [Tepidicaulis marinus]|uniref:Flagellar hook-length control protein n=1 Tax=Tepidicaulis marinus TaxID=1333998 RepID=A0A081BEM2_9HYPH|nr:flagellar hook-length control protein FliK [Tepidicaulis marinus]GAK46490.1 flagellar hook-length control protein [Tepidicaulis marinus]
MEVSTSSSQRSPETELLRRNETARLSKGAIDDAFSRHLNETRQEAKADQRGVSAAESRAEEAREARRADDKRGESSRAESQAEHQRAEKRRDEEARAKRADEKASEKAAAAREKDTPGKPAEEAQGEEADLAASLTEQAALPADTAKTGTGSPAPNGEEAAQSTANADATAPAVDGEGTEQAAQAGADTNAGKETGTQNTAAAEAAKSAQTAAASGLNTAASAAVQSTAQGTGQTNNAQGARSAAPDINAAAANGAESGGNSALQAAQAAADADLSGNLADDGALAGKDGKTLGQLAADKLSAGKEGTATEFKVAGTENAAPRPQAPATPAAAPQQATALNLAGFGLAGTEKPLNVIFDSASGLQIESLPTGTSTQNANPVQLRFGALPGQAQATQVPASAIALQIAKHVQKGVNTFEIRIDPPELGRVDVKLDVATDGRVTAHLVVEKAETLDLLQRDAKALQQALQDAGLDTDQDTLSFSLQDEGNASAFGEGREGNDGTAPGAGETGTAEAEAEVITSYRVMLNGETGVDIRV